MNRYKRCFLLLCIALAGKAYAQSGSVMLTGIVTDSSGNRLSGAQIFVQGGRPEIRSAQDGIYSLSLAPGRYTVTVSLEGFETTSVQVLLPEEDFIEESFILPRRYGSGSLITHGKYAKETPARYALLAQPDNPRGSKLFKQ